MSNCAKETWGSAAPYDLWVGRWSRKVAGEFLDWLNVGSGQAWGDVGCGTGALVESILARAEPASIVAVDRAEGFVAAVKEKIKDPRVRFDTGDATALLWPSASCDATVSGLVLNFVKDPPAMVREMARATRLGGKVAAYVWDYSGGMEMMRYFWDVAIRINPQDSNLDQAERFPICHPDRLAALFRDAGLAHVSARAIDITTIFRDFDDYWAPFLGKQGAAPTYLASLDDATRARIRAELQARLPAAVDGSISLTAKAWAVQGTVEPDQTPN
jgi:SAM-dependent methyltransferase